MKRKEFTHKKRIAAGLMAVLLLLCFSACGSSSASTSSSTGTKLLLMMPDIDDTFRALLQEKIEEAAASEGVSIDVEYTNGDLKKEVDLFKNAKSSGYTAIIARISDTDMALQMEAVSNDIPIVFINAEPSSDYLKANQYIFAGSYEQDAGSYQAEYVWNKLGNPSSFNLIILEGEKGHSATKGRTEAVKYFFKDNNVDVNYVFMDVNANWSEEDAYEKMENFEKTGQSFDAIICNNDSLALGAVNWLQDHHYSTSDIPVAGVDATAEGCQSILDGGMQFTVLQNAEGQGQKAVQAAIQLSQGKSISSMEGATEDACYIYVPFEKVDSSNVKNYM